MDLGFERAGYDVALAFDLKAVSVTSYNANRRGAAAARVANVADLTLDTLDRLHGRTFAPEGVIGGPPCQSFSMANRESHDDDPRHELPLAYARLLGKLNARSPVKFFVFENVTGLRSPEHVHRYARIKAAFKRAGFSIGEAVLNAHDYETPQRRERIFLVGLNTRMFGGAVWRPPKPTTTDSRRLTVRAAIGGLPEPHFFTRDADPSAFPKHPNHWCMQPKSRRFTSAGALIPGNGWNRSFKTLAWDAPSFTVAYGNREVHVHPSCRRRLSVFEAMRLQGFPDEYVLTGTLSSQFAQVSEAVPPRLAEAVARSIRDRIAELSSATASDGA